MKSAPNILESLGQSGRNLFVLHEPTQAPAIIQNTNVDSLLNNRARNQNRSEPNSKIVQVDFGCTKFDSTARTVSEQNNSAKELHPSMQAVLDDASRLTELPDDWDDEGGKACSKEHVERVTGFLSAIARSLLQRSRAHLPIPSINPGPGESIDVHWKVSGKELLLNIPSEPEKLGTFFGDTTGGEKSEIRGVLDLRYKNEWISQWLLPSMPCM